MEYFNQQRKFLGKFHCERSGVATKSRDLCKMEKTFSGGFSGSVKIPYAFLAIVVESFKYGKKVI